MLATFLFTFRLGSEGLWIDELFSIRDATAYDNPLEIYSNTRIRPLYYVLLSIWMRFGSGEVWLRSLSVIFSIVSVYLTYRLGRRLAGEREGVIAALLLATSPLFVNHTQEVRMYALTLCMCVAGTLCLANALLVERPQKPSQKTIFGWVLFRILGALAFPVCILMLLPDAIFIFLRFRKDRDVLFTFAAWSTLIVLAWLPAVPSILRDANPDSEYVANRAQFQDPPGFTNLVYPLKYWMVSKVVYVGKPVSMFYKLFTLLVAGLFGAGLLQKNKTPATTWIIGWYVLPLLPIIIFSWVSAQLWAPRYILFVCPYLFIGLAFGFTRLWRDWKAVAIVAALIYSLAMGGVLTHYYIVQTRPDYRANVEALKQNEQPGDGIVWGHKWDNPLTYYYDGSNKSYWLPMFYVESQEDINDWLEAFPTSHDRLWLVFDDSSAINEEFKAAIAEKYNVEQEINFTRKSKNLLLTPRIDASHAKSQ